MEQLSLTIDQARTFLLLKHGLIGEYRFHGKKGVLDYVKQAGCIQFDPIDMCGKNAELVLQSRIEGFNKPLLYEMLYEDRSLVDYFDKNLSIFCTEDWRYFSRLRSKHQIEGRGRDQIELIEAKIKQQIKEKGPLSAKDTDFKEKVDWYWSSTSLSRAALETLYFRGELIIHHKKGNMKYYALTNDYLPADILKSHDPHETEADYIKWRVKRRIGGVGLLWNKPSDAFLYINGLNANLRKKIFDEFLEQGAIIKIMVENIKEPLYCLATDISILEMVLSNDHFPTRTEFLAPLDNMLWDRNLLKILFNFDYRWEIYNPPQKRKYGYYVIPILAGKDFIGRIEIVNDKKTHTLLVKNIWYEDIVTVDEVMINGIIECIKRFAKFNECTIITYECNLS